jgi:hypothetical protein
MQMRHLYGVLVVTSEAPVSAQHHQLLRDPNADANFVIAAAIKKPMVDIASPPGNRSVPFQYKKRLSSGEVPLLGR